MKHLSTILSITPKLLLKQQQQYNLQTNSSHSMEKDKGQDHQEPIGYSSMYHSLAF